MTIRQTIDKWDGIPFAYGGADCCRFIGECVEAATGHNPVAPFEYSNEAEAADLIARYGDLNKLFLFHLGEPSRGPYKDGDITLHALPNMEQMAGVVYRGLSIVRTERGITDWPLTWAKSIWST